MTNFAERPISARDYEVGFEKRIEEPELMERSRKSRQAPRASDYVFVAELENGAGLVRKLSHVDGVQVARGNNGIFIVQFALVSPDFEARQATSVAYFSGGLYEGEVKDNTSLCVSAGDVSDARVTSGYFLNRPKVEEPVDTLMTEVMETRLRGDDLFI